MPEPRPLVRNPSDRQQVKNAEVAVRLQREKSRAAWAEVVATEAGQTVLMEMITECKMYDEMMVTSSEVYARAARHDWGVWLIKNITHASPTAWIQMQERSLKLDENRIEPERSEEE